MSDSVADRAAPAAHAEPAESPRPQMDMAGRTRSAGSFGWIDLLLVVILLLAALPIRWEYTRGDLWLDEGDYAAAAVRGFEANRWDLSDSPAEPEKMARLRHFHPPLIAHVMGLAMRWGKEDRILRVPAVLAGSLTVPLLYLCGLSLFSQASPPVRRRSPDASRRARAARAIAVSCAVVLLATPAHLRASSHALPWAFITLWLLALLWTLLMLGETGHAAWLAGTGAVLGGLFVTSEYAIPAAIAVALALPFAAWPIIVENRGMALLWGAVGGAAIFLIVAWTFWPAGLTGGIVKMLRHYAEMADDSWPVRVHGIEHTRAPKTAYVIWYWDLFKPFLLYYALGIFGATALLLRGRGSSAIAATLVVTGVVLTVAHVSHMIGPEYLVHALPLLTLLSGLFFVLLSEAHWLFGSVAAVAISGAVSTKYDPWLLSGMNAQALRPRWPAASKFLSVRWKPGDRILVPAYGGVGRWYIIHFGGLRAREWQVIGLPAPGEQAGGRILRDMDSGVYRYAAVGNTFMDNPAIDSRVLSRLERWNPVWRSDEDGAGPSRLVIYERPLERK